MRTSSRCFTHHIKSCHIIQESSKIIHKLQCIVFYILTLSSMYISGFYFILAKSYLIELLLWQFIKQINTYITYHNCMEYWDCTVQFGHIDYDRNIPKNEYIVCANTVMQKLSRFIAMSIHISDDFIYFETLIFKVMQIYLL